MDKDKVINFLLKLKLNKLNRDGNVSVSFEQLSETLYRTRWKNGVPEKVNKISDDIMSVTVSDIVNAMTIKAIVTPADLSDLIKDIEENDYEK